MQWRKNVQVVARVVPVGLRDVMRTEIWVRESWLQNGILSGLAV